MRNVATLHQIGVSFDHIKCCLLALTPEANVELVLTDAKITHSKVDAGARPFEKKIVGVTDPRPCDELIDKSAIFPGE